MTTIDASSKGLGAILLQDEKLLAYQEPSRQPSSGMQK